MDTTISAPLAGEAASVEFTDWARIFDIGQALVPLHEDAEFLQARPSTVRGLFVDLAEVAACLRRREEPGAPLLLQADVVRIATRVVLPIRSLTLHARRIEVAPGASIVLAGCDAVPAELDVSVGELGGPAPASCLEIDWLGVGQVIEPAELPCRRLLSWDEPAPGRVAVLVRSEPRPGPGDDLQAELALLMAQRLATMPRERAGVDLHDLALRLARWVNLAHAQVGGETSIAAQSAQLVGQLSLGGLPLHLVPPLRVERYLGLAHDCADALLEAESRVERFLDRHVELGERAKAARELLEQRARQLGVARDMLLQAEDELRLADAAKAQCDTRVTEQKTATDQAQKVFQDGVQAKREQLEREAVFGLIAGVVIVVVGVASTFVGNPGGPAAAAGAAGAAGNAAAKLSRLVQLGQKLMKIFENVGKAAQVAKGGYDLLNLIGKHQRDQQAAEAMQAQLGTMLPQEHVTIGDWDEFAAEARHQLAEAVRLEVSGVEDYLLAIEKLAIRGKDAVDAAQRHLACLNLARQRAWAAARDEADLEQVRQRLDGLQAKRWPDLRLMMFCRRMHDQLALQLIQAITKVGDALCYYALRPPRELPTMDLPAARLREMLVGVHRDLLEAKEHFHSPPADWGPKICRVWARRSLEQLHSRRSLSWSISTAYFKGFDRIRVSEIRVWLIGPSLGQHNVHVRIGTSGSYRDRFEGRVLEFVAEPLRRSFEYHATPNGHEMNHREQRVEITAFANDTEQSFFEPTPFTTWEISLPAEVNRGWRIEDVTEVGLEFRGTYISERESPPATAPLLELVPTLL